MASTKSDPERAMEAKIAQYAPVNVGLDLGRLPYGERNAVAYLIDAARLVDTLFLEQVWAGNNALIAKLAADQSPLAQLELRYVLINKGPFDRLNHMHGFASLGVNWTMPELPASQLAELKGKSPEELARFLEERTSQLPRASFYPSDATKDEVEKWMNSLKGDARAAATSFFTVIRRDTQGRLISVPYSQAYQNLLQAIAGLMRRAAAESSDASLKKYLTLRADALLSNDYYASDVAWMELDSPVEPVIGPYETYEDHWFGYKAGFEAFITVRDDEETKKLSSFGSELQGLEDALPIDAAYRNPRLGALAPIRVVNVVYSAGDGNRGVQTAAFNLPNDVRVTREKGTKRVMLRNTQEAKFEKVLVPISKVALSQADQARVSFDAFFTHILMHELMHGLGPHETTSEVIFPKNGKNDLRGHISVREALKDTYGAIEEAKADISGLWALRRLADAGKISGDIRKSMYTTFLASAFRSIRFGVGEAHGKGVALQLNYLLDHGAFKANLDGTYAVVDDKIADAVTALTHDLLMIEAEGNYGGAKDLLTRMGVVRPEIQRVLENLADIPIDIAPRFVTAETLMAR